jgi:hypothetical protein
MAAVDVKEMQSALVELREREAAMRHPRVAQQMRGAEPAESEAELRALLESDPGLAKLGALLTRRLVGRRATLKATQAVQRAQAESDHAAAKIAAAVEAERNALQLLAKPAAEPYVTLTKPMFILQLPQAQFSQFKDQHIEPFNSWFKVDLETDTGGVGPERTIGGGLTSFVAYYLWENPSDQYAIGSVTSSMTLNGSASAWGSSGKFSGNWALLYIEVSLTPICWTGWGTDPAGNSLDGTTYPLVATKEIVSWRCYGGDWFSSPSPQSMPLNPFNRLSIPIIAIPGGAVTGFELSLLIDWGFRADWGDGRFSAVEEDEIDDGIIVDLASDEHRACCNAVVLDLSS